MSTRVALTGATGFIGRYLGAHLQRHGWTVRGIVRPESRRAVPEGIELIRAPLSTPELGRVCAGVAIIVHLAGVTRAASNPIYRAVNVEGTRAVAEAARQVGARLVYVSSQAAAGPGTPLRPRREEDAPHPVTAYGASKLAGEEAVREAADLPWSILRPVFLLGLGLRR